MNEADPRQGIWVLQCVVMPEVMGFRLPVAHHTSKWFLAWSNNAQRGEQAIDDTTAEATHGFLKNSYWRDQ